MPDTSDSEPRHSSWFPATIQMTDTGETFLAKTMEDIPPGRNFKVLAVKVKEGQR
jgi:hypothetical protein